MSILVLGGAGYIGSHAVYQLIEHDEKVIVVDNLSTGHCKAIHPEAIFYHGDIKDKTFLRTVFQNEDIKAVIHFAACSLVGESMKNPLKYYDNNVYGTQILLQVMTEFKVKYIVFSSTAATYGEPETFPITEDLATKPTNPYGDTKLAMEKMIHWASKAREIKYISLRYFNVAGARPGGQIGEHHDPETHLVPIILQVALKQRTHITIFGNDYDTPDGTCIRDYVHIEDLIQAHLLSLRFLQTGGASNIFNLGSNRGFSVRDIIEASESVTELSIPYRLGARRTGDPANLIANSAKAKKLLKWEPMYPSIHEIIQHAWDWHVSHPNGFGKEGVCDNL